jgi:hypothetical protein
MMISRRRAIPLALAAAFSPLAASTAEAKSGRVEFRLVRAGFIIGLGGGSGWLVFEGKRYPISVGGVSLGATIGAASADLVGRVYNLRRASDIEGTYTATGAGLAVAGGGTTARLRNARGVVLEVRGKQIGFMASIDLSGLSVRLQR